MIPKIIHYCWFGGKPLPKSAQKCIASWRKFFPDYTIKRWDESNYDIDTIPYIRDAYAAKKYAFVSDYARFDILYREGGIYFDTDVEVIRSFDDILEAGSFMGCQTVAEDRHSEVATGLGLADEAGGVILEEILLFYKNLEYKDSHGISNPDTVVTYVTEILKRHGLKEKVDEVQKISGINIYPADYFCPLSTVDGKLRITENTRSIHKYDQSWQSPIRKYGRKILLKIGGPKLITFMKPYLLKK